MMAKNTIANMRKENWRGITGQNGYNDHFYRIYDDDGRIAGSKEGIVTVPGEMMPRQAHVEVNLDGFQPRAVFSDTKPRAFTPRSEIQAEGGQPGDTWTVQKQNWRTTPAQGELKKFKEGGYDAKHRPAPPAPKTPAPKMIECGGAGCDEEVKEGELCPECGYQN
jgi:hypothetical protein